MMDQVTKAQTRQFLYDLHVDDVAQKQHIMRAATATGYGLDPGSYTRPFPGTTTITNVTKETSGALKAIAGGGLAALATSGLLAGAAALWSGAHQVAPSPAPATAQQAADPADPAELRVSWWIEGEETGGKVEQLPSEGSP